MERSPLPDGTVAIGDGEQADMRHVVEHRHRESRFTTRPEDRDGLTQMVAEQIYQAGFEAIRHHLKEAA